MNKYTYTLTLVTLLLPVTSNGDSMIGDFLKKFQSSKDLSQGRPGIKKTGNGMFYVYKLDNGTPSRPSDRPLPPQQSTGREYNHVAIAKHKQEMAQKKIEKAVEDEKQVLYGSDESPIKNPSVIAAWDKADAAQRRLKEHREYMERVRQGRKNISDEKSITK